MNKWDKLYKKLQSIIEENDITIEKLIMSFDKDKSKKITHYQKVNETLYRVIYLMETLEENNEM